MNKDAMKKFGMLMAAGLSVAGASVHAALPAEATSAITSISGSITDAEAAVWPVIGVMLVAGLTIKVVKRFTAKI